MTKHFSDSDDTVEQQLVKETLRHDPLTIIRMCIEHLKYESNNKGQSRALSLTITKLEEAAMWREVCLEEQKLITRTLHFTEKYIQEKEEEVRNNGETKEGN